MRPENKSMKALLLNHGINTRVKFIRTGSLKGTWRINNPKLRWTEEIAEKLEALGFCDYDGRPFTEFSGNGGYFSIFARYTAK